MKFLITKNSILKTHDQNTESTTFPVECHKRLIEDIKFIVHSQNRYNISFKQKIAIFVQFLLDYTHN